VVLIDRDRLFADAVTIVLERHGFEVIGLSDGPDAIRSLAETTPDLVLIDASAASSDADLEITGDDRPRIVVLEDESTRIEPDVLDWADGVVSKELPTEEFVDAVESIAEGRPAPQTVTPIPRGQGTHSGIDGVALTERERDVLQLLVEGAGATEISRELGVTRHTARKHVQNVLTKLQVHSRLAAMMFAIEHGLVDVPRGLGDDGRVDGTA
jgi:two-component system nitrate/nitrite response regulator NarL